MSVAAARPVRQDGLIRTTIRIGADPSEASLAAIVHALQRVPGVLTVDADADNRQAFVAHDAAVPTAALVVAVNRAGSPATAVASAAAVAASNKPGITPRAIQQQPLMTVVGLAAVLAIIFIDIALANNPEKRWLFIIPLVLLWVFVLLRATLTRRL